MKKIVKISESELVKVITKLLKEQANLSATAGVGFNKKENINPKGLKLGAGGNKNPKQREDVIQLQQKLINLGLLKTRTGKPTGYFGNFTQSALNSYLSGNQNVAKPEDSKQKSKISPEKTPQKSKYQLTPRIDQELNFIKQRGMDDKPFFIYDPEQNLIYLFNKGGSLIDYSQVVDGADAQKNAEPMTHEKWCKLSGLDVSPYKCTDTKTKQKKDPYYSVIANVAERFIPKGIYSIKSLIRHEGYTGVGKNQFQMVDDKGSPIAAAIHGIPNLPDRLSASNDLESLLKKDLSSGKVPEKYLKSIKAIANANRSFGCVGVPAKFIDNPNVQKLAQGARVFVMGEGKDFLVQNALDYFEKLGSDGENCVNPNSLASKMSTMA